jgi:hypothetical protein
MNLNTRLLVGILVINITLPVSSTSAYVDKKPVFYLWAKPGCYSANLKSSPTIPMYSVKKIYPVSCLAPHHFEVFYAGQFTTKDGRVGAGGREVVADCLQKSKTLGFYIRSDKSYNWSKDEEALIGNWMADIGAESKRFPNRSICYTSITTKSWLYIKEVNSPVIRGYEKYDN